MKTRQINLRKIMEKINRAMGNYWKEDTLNSKCYSFEFNMFKNEVSYTTC